MRLRRPLGRLAAGAALAIAVGVVVVLVVRNQGSPSTPSATAGTTGLGVATVQRRNLVASETESGTLGYAGAQTVYNRISGTITWLPRVGRVVRAGQALFRVADKPAILLYGSTPVFRDLDHHDSDGPDITQLNRNLVKLGFDPDGIVVDDEWQAATTAGVEELQESLGVTATGKLSLGRVVFLPGPQLISKVDAIVGGTGGGSPSQASDPVGSDSSATQFVDLQGEPGGNSTTATTTTATTATSRSTDTSTSTTTQPPTTATSTPTSTTTQPPTTAPSSRSPSKSGSDGGLSSAIDRLGGEIQALRGELQAENQANRESSSADNSNSANNSNSGNNSSSGNGSHSGRPTSTGSSSATEILETSSPGLEVTVDLSASSQSEAVVGATVTVLMPDGSTVKGKIASVSRVAQSSSGGSATIPVTIKLRGRRTGAGLDQASVSVKFVKSSARHVLSVPVTALVATSGESYALQQAAAPHTLIPVRTGLFAAGYVQVSGRRVVPGLRVTNSEG